MTNVFRLAPRQDWLAAHKPAPSHESVVENTKADVIWIFSKVGQAKVQTADQKNDQNALRVFEPLYEGAVVFHYSEAQKAIKSEAQKFITDTTWSVTALNPVVIKKIAQEDFSNVHDSISLEEIENIRMHGAEELADAFDVEISKQKRYFKEYLYGKEGVPGKIADFQSRLPYSSEKTQSQISAFIAKANAVNLAMRKITRMNFLSRLNAVVQSKTAGLEQHLDFSDPVRFRSMIGLSAADYALLPPAVKQLVDNFQKCMNMYFDNFKASEDGTDNKTATLSLVSNVG